MVKKLNLIIATLYSVILATVETLLNNYWNDWEYFPLWIVDYFIAIILLSAVFLFKNNYQKIMLISGWSFSAGVTYMALFISLEPSTLKSPDIEGKLPLIALALIVSILGFILTIIDFKNSKQKRT